jgi:phosphoenolpyruvate phosphomutase
VSPRAGPEDAARSWNGSARQVLPRPSLRDLLTTANGARAAGAYDGLSAKLIERAGFEAVWASSFTISASRGLPDMSLLTMTEYLDATCHMVNACDIPVLADCDTGFGSAVNVAHMVKRYESAGVAGVCIEDKVFPKTNSFIGERQELVSCDQFMRKIEVGKESQSDPDFVIVGRTEALICGLGLEEALYRARRYVEAGADAILVHSKRSSPQEINEFLGCWDGVVPVVVVPTTYYSWSIEEAFEAGASMVIYANQALRAAVAALREALEAIERTGSSVAVEASIAPIGEVFELQGVEEWMELDR